jgi:hypothetical protein
VSSLHAGVVFAEAISAGADDPASSTRRGWIQGPLFDLALFTLSPLSGILVVLTAMYMPFGQYIGPAVVYLVAIPHYLSTFTFYFVDDQVAYHRTRWVAFFVGPLICIAVVVAALVWRQAALFQSGVFIWNVYHVALQSAGILSLYRWLNGGAATERRVSVLAILAVNASMAFFRLERYPPLHGTLSSVHPLLPELLWAASVVVAVLSLVAFGYRLMRRSRPIALPEGAFLATSLLLFHPYLWVDDSELATIGMLTGHFVQYLTIVWLLHRRKCRELPSGSLGHRFLGYISGRTPVLVGTLVSTGLLLFIVDRVTTALGSHWVYQVSWNVLVIMHFYLDGLIWTFRRPFVRASIGKYLIREDHRVV